jgi:hypothetical protein
MKTRSRLGAATGLVLALALGGCGAGGGKPLAAASGSALHGRVDQIRAAAARGDAAAFERALDGFRGGVQALLAEGAIDPDDARGLLAEADGLEPLAPAPSPAAKPSASAEPASSAEPAGSDRPAARTSAPKRSADDAFGARTASQELAKDWRGWHKRGKARGKGKGRDD